MPSPSPSPSPSPGYRSVFRVREFRAVFAAHLLSVLGVVVAEISLTVLVYRLTGSPLMSALTFALGFLPYVIGGTLLAPVADRYPARRVLVICDLVCAGCAAAMVVPGTPVAVLLALRCAMAVVAPLFQGTRNASLADILGPGDAFVLGRSLLRMVAQSAQLVGFGLGGLLLAVVAPRAAIALTAAGLVGSALLLRFGTRARPARAGRAARTSPLAGVRAVLGERRTRALTLMFWVPSFFVVVPEALMAPYVDGLGAGTVALGLAMCALPVGTIAGELWAGSRLSARTRSRIVVPLAAVGLLPLLGYLARPGVPVLLAVLVLAGLAHAYTLGLDQWYVETVPEEARGRAMTLLSTGLMTLQGAGMALAGLAAEFLPLHVVVAGAGALGTVCVLWLLGELRATAPGAAPAPVRSKDETGLTTK
ncbi:MFS transporter [Streptomyces sp. NPDC090022]|uniref:MFS transporter n=1 Tax=Streptomyces sp. NPDC090022 TaxID=3365920 RepID=UPI00382BEC8A